MAKALHAPNATLMMESGIIDIEPCVPPNHIADANSCRGFSYATDLFSMFTMTYRGFIDVCFLGVAQIDRFGNINSTVIGDYAAPTVRLPGSGGANEIALHSRQVFVVMRQSKRSFVERIDFCTSPGNSVGGRRGPSVVVTDLGVYHFDVDAQMRLDTVHPGVSLDDVRGAIEWDLRVSPELSTTPPPSAEELRLIREVLDPDGRYTA